MKTNKILMIALAAFIGFGMVMILNHARSQSTSDRKALYYTCPMHPSVKADKPGSCPICGMNLEPVYGDDATNTVSSGTNNATTNSAAKPYPFDTCLVDGMKLGSMGDPYVFVYQGQEVKFCCVSCKPVFLNDPDKYLKKIQDTQK
ncbi:MAG TPA: heavy metal-binding domain-containing protein [Verrucomicrobiae bacterium]